MWILIYRKWSIKICRTTQNKHSIANKSHGWALQLGKLEKSQPDFFQVYLILYESALYDAQKSSLVVTGPRFFQQKTIALSIWSLELLPIKNKHNHIKIPWPSPFNNSIEHAFGKLMWPLGRFWTHARFSRTCHWFQEFSECKSSDWFSVITWSV